MYTTTLRPRRLTALAIFALLLLCTLVVYGRTSASVRPQTVASRAAPLVTYGANACSLPTQGLPLSPHGPR
jgi:hypothetical protein